jgi:hypothetical protein
MPSITVIPDGSEQSPAKPPPKTRYQRTQNPSDPARYELLTRCGRLPEGGPVGSAGRSCQNATERSSREGSLTLLSTSPEPLAVAGTGGVRVVGS